MLSVTEALADSWLGAKEGPGAKTRMRTDPAKTKELNKAGSGDLMDLSASEQIPEIPPRL
jgi:hypothetical protein